MADKIPRIRGREWVYIVVYYDFYDMTKVGARIMQMKVLGTSFFKTPKIYKVTKCYDIMEFLSLKGRTLDVLTSLSYYLVLF